MPRSPFARAAAPLALAAAVPALLLVATPAAAQFSKAYNFMQAVKNRRQGDNTEKAMTAVREPGSNVVNSRDSSTGETVLHYVTRDRDAPWLRFLLANGGNPDLADNEGTTPLMIAAQLRFGEAVEALIAGGATVDKANGRGETALIRAVQVGDIGIVRLLIAAGANPDKRDTLAGLSARDYARRDARFAAIATALDQAKPAAPRAPMQGPGL